MACIHCRRRKAKCDEARPSCSLCLRLKKECHYVEVAGKRGPKKRNVKELENRIAMMEARISAVRSETRTDADALASSSAIEPDKVAPGTDYAHDIESLQILEDPFLSLQHDDLIADVIAASTFGEGSSSGPTTFTPSEGYQPMDIISLGRYGNLPDDSTIDALTKIYFTHVHPCVPIIHEARYRTNVNLNTSQRPALCLQYIMWALAAQQSTEYVHLAEFLHRSSRQCIEEDELANFESNALTVSHVQCWVLNTWFESFDMNLLRGWMSVRRGITLAQILKLDKLDRAPASVIKVLPEARDFVEMEERRRTFWLVYSIERWTSGGTGNPVIINEEDIFTDLPCSDEAFLLGLSEPTQTFQDALENGLSPSSCALGAFAVQSGILHRSIQLANNVVDQNSVDQVHQAKFWEQHYRLDNMMAVITMSRSDNLRLSTRNTNPLLIKFVTGMHALTLSLHQCAIRFAQKHGADASRVAKSVNRCRQQADEIVDIIRSVAHVDYKLMHPFTSSCLYTAATIFMKDYKEGYEEQLSLEKLRFALKSLKLFARPSKAAKMFVERLEEEIAQSNIAIT